VVEKTLGLKAGPDEDNLHDYGLQPVDFDYNAPWPLQSEVSDPAYMVTSWNKSGRVLVRQDLPLPMTVLAASPTGGGRSRWLKSAPRCPATPGSCSRI
jgi:hypothetical protein